MSSYHYELIFLEENVEDSAFRMCYGMQVSDAVTGEVLFCNANLTPEVQVMADFIVCMRRENVALCHIPEVVEDFFLRKATK